jgi:hypothetical protein
MVSEDELQGPWPAAFTAATLNSYSWFSIKLGILQTKETKWDDSIFKKYVSFEKIKYYLWVVSGTREWVALVHFSSLISLFSIT